MTRDDAARDGVARDGVAYDGIEAYDLPDRVAVYDADMDIMHPLRHAMMDIALEVVPLAPTATFTALDLGTGTSVFAQRVLEDYPRASVVAVDGAAAMLHLAGTRLAGYARRVTFIEADFRSLPTEATSPGSFDLVVSAYALHHLDADAKRAVLRTVIAALKPCGWFVNADIVTAADPDIERRIQDIRVRAVTARAPDADERFRTFKATRAYLDALETREHDQPLTLDAVLRLLRAAGIPGAEVFWRQYREVVIGGPKPVG
ncbi:MAG: class I SAM-dependent methyltransferase [Actinobacteria bacterium]|nr:class I SAM-dependent methyltransferase [Actinomycetota bacterium]